MHFIESLLTPRGFKCYNALKSIMASKQNSKRTTLEPSKNKFAESLLTISRRFSLFTVFDDFLTLTIAAYTQKLVTGKSWYEDHYLETIEKYKDSELRYEFPKALSYLIIEMEERLGTLQGNDILGDFFEQHISNGKNGQYFTPHPICTLMASTLYSKNVDEPDIDTTKPLRIMDSACGSGRMLLAAHEVIGVGHEYYGIDIDHICAKMTALNLFLHGMWNSEVLCADSLMPNDFVVAYRISFVPLGIFKIEVKEHSKLWRLHQYSAPATKANHDGAGITPDSTPFTDRQKNDATQLNLF